ncbi:uncharacterized protein MCAP_0864-like [Onthophagus taurus]|uniref:uncharacterized protein MCAP_0864-like n=1 Tax=Onthophagus taurus TaxID=166361 RepID=UPI0039BE872A
MFSQTDDDDLFPTNINSNLTNLFGGGSITNPQTDLKYTAPRQPRPTDLIPKELNNTNVKMEPEKVSVVCAKVVIANKLINDEVVKVGKFGFAILGTNKIIKEFLLYRDRQNVLAKASNNDQFKFIEEGKDCLKFTDDSEIIWLIQFINNDEHAEFIKEINLRNVRISKSQKHPLKKDNLEEDSQIRADILTRMAKMGQSVLPGQKLDENKTNETKIIENPSQISDVVKDKHPENTSVVHQNQYLNTAQIQPYIPLQTYQFPQIPSNQEFNLFMSENRTHNSEMRINLTSISTKLDSVLYEMSKIKVSPNTDRLENEFLKSKIYDLEEKLKRCDEIGNSESLIKIKELEENNRDLEKDLKRLKIKSERVDDLERKESLMLEEIDKLKIKLKEKDVKFIEIEKKMIENEIYYKKCLEESVNKKDKIDNGNVIKESMNEMFQNVLGEFDEENVQISFKQLKNSLSKHLKQTTFKIIDSLK